MTLLSAFGKRGSNLGLLSKKVDIEDTEYLSKYFVLSEFNPVFSAGKNAVSFNGSSLLKDKSEIQVECLDSRGNSLYLEYAKSVEAQFTDVAKFLISIHVYDEIYNGPGKLILIGTTTKGELVRWIGNITIDKTLDNTSKVRFYYKPELTVRPLLYPVIDTSKAKIEYPPPPPIEEATATATIHSGVNSVRVTAKGDGYTSTPTISFNNAGTGGSGAIAIAHIVSEKLDSIEITNAGSGYLSPPIVVITGDCTTAASANAQLLSEVVSITVNNQGQGYTSIPEVQIISTTGYGARATATLSDKKITAITVTSGGNGYITAPTIKLEYPEEPPAPELNVPVNFSASCITYAATPPKDTNKNVIDFKHSDIDYRLTITSSAFRPISPDDVRPQTFPSNSFNSQMEGCNITVHVTSIQKPYSYVAIPVNMTASFTIKKVLDSRTVLLNEPFFYSQGKNQFISNIASGRCFVNYRFILYNTSQDSSKQYNISPTEAVDVKESHAEIVYKNLKCYSGFVTRHKLYRKSSFTPGDFQLISDELLSPSEMLSDPVTFNQFYENIGTFYNQVHIEKYWFTSSAALNLTASINPINSMRIGTNTYDETDGDQYVIAKTDTIGGTNDNKYYPYDKAEYNSLSGSGYNSNFINLKKDVTYVLSTDLILEKSESDPTSNIAFYFTSSIDAIKTEKDYSSKYGLKLGEITSTDTVPIKYFNSKQHLYFTPNNDYFGTLVIVPYHCNAILSNLSLKVYGDHGFSPDIHVIKIPFPVSVANEAFDIKAELLDLNSNVVYSNLKTTQTFDPDGDSAYSSATDSTINSVINVADIHAASGPNITVEGTPYFPDLQNCDDTIRIVGWHAPIGDVNDGKLCYTNISRLYVDSGDYITLHEYQSGVEVIAKSIAVQYDFSKNMGRKIFIDAAGTKETFP